MMHAVEKTHSVTTEQSQEKEWEVADTVGISTERLHRKDPGPYITLNGSRF